MSDKYKKIDQAQKEARKLWDESHALRVKATQMEQNATNKVTAACSEYLGIQYGDIIETVEGYGYHGKTRKTRLQVRAIRPFSLQESKPRFEVAGIQANANLEVNFRKTIYVFVTGPEDLTVLKRAGDEQKVSG